MTRFLHTADLHLNAQRRRFPHYQLRAEWVLAAIEEVAVSQNCDCIVIAGDVFDQTNLTIAERQLLSDWLGQLRIPVLMISGNHDARSQQIGDTCLSYLSSLQLQLHLIHDGDPRILQAFGVTWLLFPYHGWPNHEFRLICAAMVERVRQKRPDETIIVVMHEAVVGATTEHGITVTKSEQIKLTDDLGVDYWALGDIHAGQEILPSGYYCGAPYQIDFGETAQNCGVVVVDTEDPHNPQLVELECPYPLVTLQEPPDEWPLFCVYCGDDNNAPEHVVWQPARAGALPEIKMQRARVPLFYRLEEILVEQQHPEDLLQQTIEIANQMAVDLELEI